MARAASAKDNTAARVAARRRVGKSEDRPARSSSSQSRSKGKGSKGKGKTSNEGGFLRLLFRMAGMAVLGFVLVLVLDVGGSLIGKVKFGQGTVSDLWHHMVDRVLDRDVPKHEEPKGKPLPPPRAPRPTVSPAAHAQNDDVTEPEPRAPIPAPAPSDYAKHVDDAHADHVDPQVEKAKERLNDLLGRIGTTSSSSTSPAARAH